MTRRDVATAFLIAAVAATAFVAGMGWVVSQGFDSAGRLRYNEYTSTEPAAVAFDGASQSVPVFCYHYIRHKSDPLRLLRVFGYVVLSLPLLGDSELWTTSISEFERQMEYLKAHGYHAVTLGELHEWQMGMRELPGRPVVITFDDGDQSVYDLAFPILARLGFRATLFVVTSRVGTRWNEVDCLDWGRLRELEESGVFQIESHSHDIHYKVDADGSMHPVFVAASEHGFEIDGASSWEDAVRDDLIRSYEAIERHIGRAPAFLAWPYGTATPELDRVAREAGYLRTCTLRARSSTRFARGLAEPSLGEIGIPRYTITARTSLREFRSMLEGTYRPGV
jgi:peptidoglycan/xylan/chitin deacetylase (PgdA/CDA1 family)